MVIQTSPESEQFVVKNVPIFFMLDNRLFQKHNPARYFGEQLKLFHIRAVNIPDQALVISVGDGVWCCCFGSLVCCFFYVGERYKIRRINILSFIEIRKLVFLLEQRSMFDAINSCIIFRLSVPSRYENIGPDRRYQLGIDAGLLQKH